MDSASTSFAISMLAFHAAQMRQNGLPATEIVAQLVEDTLHIGTYYLIDDISFLIKGGRISSIKGGLLTKMSIKPIVGARNGMAYHHSNALGFQKGLAKLVSLFRNNAFPAPMCLFPIPTAFPRPNSWKKPFSAPHPVPLFELGRCAEPCVPMLPDTIGCFSIRSSLFNFHFPKESTRALFYSAYGCQRFDNVFFCFGSMPASFIGTEKKPLAGFLGKLTVKAPLCYHQTK